MKKVYICSSLKTENYDYVTSLLKALPEAIHLRPHASQWEADDKRNFVAVDVAMIHHCDEIWVLGRYGRDCSWEIGYGTGIGKRVRILKDDSNRATIDEDWMLIQGIMTGNLFIHNSIHDFRKSFEWGAE